MGNRLDWFSPEIYAILQITEPIEHEALWRCDSCVDSESIAPVRWESQCRFKAAYSQLLPIENDLACVFITLWTIAECVWKRGKKNDIEKHVWLYVAYSPIQDSIFINILLSPREFSHASSISVLFLLFWSMKFASDPAIQSAFATIGSLSRSNLVSVWGTCTHIFTVAESHIVVWVVYTQNGTSNNINTNSNNKQRNK